jgi:hypothetical protein
MLAMRLTSVVDFTRVEQTKHSGDLNKKIAARDNEIEIWCEGFPGLAPLLRQLPF